MDEISVILKNNVVVTIEEFRVLDRYSYSGKIWTLIEKPKNGNYVITLRAIEYIFDSEAFTVFKIISNNILAQWQTELTKNLGYNQEYTIKDGMTIRPYYKNF